MGSSFVKYDNFGFWVWDSYVEGLLYLLTRELKKTNNSEEWIISITEEWEKQYSSGFSGFVTANLDKFFNTSTKQKTLRQSLLNVIDGLTENENFLTVEELNFNKVGGEDCEWKGINNKEFIHAAKLMVRLIDGELRTDASSPIDYWNLEEEK